MRGRWLHAVVAACLLLAVAGLVSAAVGARPTTLEAQTREVASTLRCPTCVGEDVADSTSPVAASMRTAVTEQLAAGRSPEEVRQWFADRYGDDVLLDPPPRGTALLLWVVPVVLLAGAGVALARAPGAAGTGAPVLATAVGAGVVLVTVAVWGVSAVGGAAVSTAQPSGAPTAAPDGAVLRALADDAPGDGALQLAAARATDTEGQVAEALPYYAAAARLDPLGTVPNYLHASALVRTDAPGEAVAVLEQVVAGDPRHAPSVLLLGTLLQRAGDPRGESLLREFLGLVGEEHPAAADVRRLIEQQSTAQAGP